MPGDAAVSESINPRTRDTVSVVLVDIHAVKAPNGMPRADDVPTTQRVSQPRDGFPDRAARASLLFPTPGTPRTTMPDISGAVMASSIWRISSERPVSGHDKRTSAL